jgi:hypothetical protein
MKVTAHVSILVTAQIEVDGVENPEHGIVMQPLGIQYAGNAFIVPTSQQIDNIMQKMLMAAALNNAAMKSNSEAVTSGAEMVTIKKADHDEEDGEPNLN